MNSLEFTSREREVLNLIVAGPSNQEMDNALCITEGTVKAYVDSILSKLAVSDRTQAVGVALKRGMVQQI